MSKHAAAIGVGFGQPRYWLSQSMPDAYWRAPVNKDLEKFAPSLAVEGEFRGKAMDAISVANKDDAAKVIGDLDAGRMIPKWLRVA